MQQTNGAPVDEDLLAAWREGDEAAFGVLFDRYRDRVTAYAWRMLRHREEAEEICVDAFCKVLEGHWQPTGSFRSFVFTVVHRLCLDKIKRRGRGVRALSFLYREPSPPDGTPEDDAVGDERRVRLERALADLSQDHRATVLLFYGQDLPSKEVADILGCSDQQVRSRLSYARRRLRDVLVPDEQLPP